MSAMITAVVASAVIGAGASAYSAKKSAKAAARGQDMAMTAEEQQLAFEQQRYDEWKEVYGPMQANLANYHSQMTPEIYAAAGIVDFEAQFEKSQKRMAETLEQRGIVDSGISASIEAQSELAAAEARAGIRRDAEAAVREGQTNFLQIGLGQNPAGSVSNAMGQTTQNAYNYAMRLEQQALRDEAAAGQAIGNAIGSIGNAIYRYNNPAPAASVNQDPNNIGTPK